jgi:hypothetical protein
MINPGHTNESAPPSGNTQPPANGGGSGGTSMDSGANPPPGSEPKETLTIEEQMARYEDYLKENDWGHRPC